MGLLDDLSKEVQIVGTEYKNRERIWKKYLDSYMIKKDLAEKFRQTNDLAILEKISELLPPELIDTDTEEMNESKLLSNLKRLASEKVLSGNIHRPNLKEQNLISDIISHIFDEEKKSIYFYNLLEKLTELLKMEAQIILAIKNKNREEYSFYLRNLIVVREFDIINLWRHELVRKGNENLNEIFHKILRGIQPKEAFDDVDEKYMRIEKEMLSAGSELNALAQDLYKELLNLVDFDKSDASSRLFDLSEDDTLLQKMITKLHPRYPKDKIDLIIKAFKKHCSNGEIQG